MRRRFIILPPENICRFAAKLAFKSAGYYRHWYIVDNKKFQPHITLFDVEINQKNSRRTLEKIKPLVAKVERPELRFDGVWTNPQDGSIGIAIRETKSFLKFRTLLQKLFRSEKIQVIPSANLAHITMTKYRNIGDEETVAKKLKVSKKKFKPFALAFVKVNIHGQFKKSVNIFKF